MSQKETRTTQDLSLSLLAQSPAGLFRAPIDSNLGSAESKIAISRVRGNFANIKMPEGIHCATLVTGSGTGYDYEGARIPAIAEALERYCSSVYSDDQFILASARELTDQCIDIDILPRCSAAELSHPRCLLIEPNKNLIIRWVKGISLIEGKEMYLPAIMCYSQLHNILPGERFWFPISTGCAAHVNIERALFAAICEVIERDAIALTWLHQLRLPRIVIDEFPSIFSHAEGPYSLPSSTCRFEYYDATLDIGIPTVYGLRIASDSERARTVVGCSTGSTITDAIDKVFRDLVTMGEIIKFSTTYPETFDKFTHLLHGAAYMADRARETAFDFLRNNDKKINLSQLRSSQGPIHDLPSLLERLKRCGMSAYAVDLTTDEATRANMKVVRVIIPELQPLSFHYLARFLGHPRIYNAPLPAGLVIRQEPELNPLPQPFA